MQLRTAIVTLSLSKAISRMVRRQIARRRHRIKIKPEFNSWDQNGSFSTCVFVFVSPCYLNATCCNAIVLTDNAIVSTDNAIVLTDNAIVSTDNAIVSTCNAIASTDNAIASTCKN